MHKSARRYNCAPRSMLTLTRTHHHHHQHIYSMVSVCAAYIEESHVAHVAREINQINLNNNNNHKGIECPKAEEGHVCNDQVHDHHIYSDNSWYMVIGELP